MKRKRSGGKRKPKMTPMVGAKEGFLNAVTLNTHDVSFLDDYDNAELYSRMETDAPQNGSNESRQQTGLQKLVVVDLTMLDSMNSFPEKNIVVSANLSRNARSKMTKSSGGLVASSIKPSSNTRIETDAPQNGNSESRQHTANLLKNARGKITKSSRGLATSSIKPRNDTEVVQGGRTYQKDPKLPKSSRGSAASSIKANSETELVQGGRRTHQKDPKSPLQDPLYKEQELKAALAVIRKVMKMDSARPFNLPVDPIALGIHDYFDVIDTPMDFGTICKNLENGVRYKNSKDVFGDVQYVWENCSKYNGEGHHISELMKRVKKNFTKYWTEAGLYEEQPQEINGYSHEAPMESTMRCSTHGHSSLAGSIIDYPRHQQQHQMDLSQHQPYHFSRSYIMSYQQQKMPCQHQCQCQLRSGEQQTSHPQAGRNVGSAELAGAALASSGIKWVLPCF
ncbi:bromodomain-containing factor 1-like [Camellia sinensis]|uniref:bromodomain-containing factor 1-like n=1 Tax=Camellia sinensis TaxID=4442 RepID=UPI001036BCF0|nr:bromodomain-containing factor 1-like [Camellia sinensis]